MTVNATDNTAALDARYGRTPQRRRDRILLIVGGAVFAVILVAWVIWVGIDGNRDSLGTQDIAHSIIDDSSVTVTWQVSVKAGTAVSCALQAQNEAHAIVGWKIVDLPASTNFNNRYKEEVRTSQQAVTGLIYQCWLT